MHCVFIRLLYLANDCSNRARAGGKGAIVGKDKATCVLISLHKKSESILKKTICEVTLELTELAIMIVS